MFAGKVALITGGARGIGAATAELFASNGAWVVIADVLDEPGRVLSDRIGGFYVHCDVTNETDVESAVGAAVTWKGRLDVVFNNAGIGGAGGSILTTDMREVDAVVRVNVSGVVHGIKHAARVMKPAGGGSIICCSSTAALMGGLGSHAYTLSKEAIVGVVRSSACELGEYGIRVNSVSPHGVASEMMVAACRRFIGSAAGVDDVEKMVAEGGSLLRGRAGRAEDVAQAVMFLANEEASGFITGHNLVIDGGYTAAFNHLSFIYRDPLP